MKLSDLPLAEKGVENFKVGQREQHYDSNKAKTCIFLIILLAAHHEVNIHFRGTGTYCFLTTYVLFSLLDGVGEFCMYRCGGNRYSCSTCC